MWQECVYIYLCVKFQFFAVVGPLGAGGFGFSEFFGIASIVSVFKNVGYMSDKKTDMFNGVQNVIVDTAGRGTLMLGGAKAGSLVLILK